MKTPKILITGDSFAADWTKKYPNEKGWPNFLAEKYNVTNIAQAGVSEYKIWLQIKNQNLNSYDVIIISHTNPGRVHTRAHPIHYNDLLHKDADLLINDIYYHKSKIKNFLNFSLRCASSWFKYHYDYEFQEVIYDFFKKDITRMIGNIPCIELTNFDETTTDLCYFSYLKTNPGIANHMDEIANKKICSDISEKINTLINHG